MTESDNAHRAFRRRRRSNHPGGRDKKIEVKVTATEEQQLRAAAEQSGMTVQRLMVSRALGSPTAGSVVDHRAKVTAWSEAMDMRNLLSGLGVNMNQIARHANTEDEIPPDFGPACDAVRRASDRVRDAFGDVFAVSFPATKRGAGPEGGTGAGGSDLAANDGGDPDGWAV